MEPLAFTRMVERERPVMLRVARRIVGPQEAEDVVQTALMRVWKYAADATIGNERALLMRVLRNTAYNVLEARRPAAELGDWHTPSRDVTEVAEERAEAHEALRLIAALEPSAA